MSDSPRSPTIDTEFNASPILATVEVDRFCERCGYNLLTSPVRREPRTAVLMTRCSECGCFNVVSQAQTAASPWLHRLSAILLAGWILLVSWLTVMLSIAQGAIAYAVLEFLTRWDNARRMLAQRAQPPPDFTEAMVLLGGVELLLAFLSISLLMVVCHHWRRWVYVLVALALPLIIGSITLWIWREDAPELADWGARVIFRMMGVSWLGSLLGAVWGRAAARRMVQILLPPRPRQFMSFLWLADGLRPTGCAPLEPAPPPVRTPIEPS